MISNGKRKIPCVDLFIYRCMKEKSVRGIFINYSEVKKVMFYCRIPKKIHHIILREMEELKLIKRMGNTRNIYYKLLKRDADKLLDKNWFI
ncbi:MAG: hypothetical protein ACOC56_02545 [Atribacterota bacterium]